MSSCRYLHTHKSMHTHSRTWIHRSMHKHTHAHIRTCVHMNAHTPITHTMRDLWYSPGMWGWGQWGALSWAWQLCACTVQMFSYSLIYLLTALRLHSANVFLLTDLFIDGFAPAQCKCFLTHWSIYWQLCACTVQMFFYSPNYLLIILTNSFFNLFISFFTYRSIYKYTNPSRLYTFFCVLTYPFINRNMHSLWVCSNYQRGLIFFFSPCQLSPTSGTYFVNPYLPLRSLQPLLMLFAACCGESASLFAASVIAMIVLIRSPFFSYFFFLFSAFLASGVCMID